MKMHSGNRLRRGVKQHEEVGALASGLPHQDHVYSTTDKLFRFHNKNLDEMRGKLDSTKNLRSLRNIQPHLNAFLEFAIFPIKEIRGSKNTATTFFQQNLEKFWPG